MSAYEKALIESSFSVCTEALKPSVVSFLKLNPDVQNFRKALSSYLSVLKENSLLELTPKGPSFFDKGILKLSSDELKKISGFLDSVFLNCTESVVDQFVKHEQFSLLVSLENLQKFSENHRKFSESRQDKTSENDSIENVMRKIPFSDESGLVFYAGIGSRETPQNVLEKMELIGRLLALKKYVLRSGGAIGADLAFESGCDSVGGKKQIFLVSDSKRWQVFKKNIKPGSDIVGYDETDVSFASHSMKKHLNKNLSNYSEYAYGLQSRNVRQIFGEKKDIRSRFVVAYTENGLLKGGTATALALCKDSDIPVVNLGDVRFKDMSAEKIVSYIEKDILGLSPKKAEKDSSR